jgi:hypothetical protein
MMSKSNQRRPAVATNRSVTSQVTSPNSASWSSCVNVVRDRNTVGFAVGRPVSGSTVAQWEPPRRSSFW